ncbi:putative splicing factor TSR1 [Trypanosoma rangeli]|uniref:Putative splicing factor TSR1 n=1 Tax=Trypanosoma rangeli TaxID=5698 RepID=A0A3R7RCG9_TRYRA|nr:putative splicing factor TSR1 [Trypanosoma rangeli]RNE99709.1 putative splicing factor TSR1 [Trypanosoma rangeli]|eukprot:RNE99709.1 putative splicing factor TSR1 [Trypanosoma rangeli]
MCVVGAGKSVPDTFLEGLAEYKHSSETMSETRSGNSAEEQPRVASQDNESNNNAPVTTPAAATTSVFIGLGPAASTISDEALRERLEEVAPVLGVRIRGRCAFADVPDPEAAARLVSELNGKLIGEARMAVQLSRSKEKERPPVNNNHNKNGNNPGRTSLFVGLGPAGGAISDKELRNKLEEVAPITGFRRRGQCAFVDVADVAQASRMIDELNNQYIGDCRLSVQYSRDNKTSRSGGRMEKRSRSPIRRGHHHRSRRSDSPDRRRCRRRKSRSYSSRSSSSRRSSYYSDDSRDRHRHDKRDRRRRERSRSYSSRSRSSSPAYRKRRD